MRREDLLADARAQRVTAPWIAAANLSEIQPDRMRRLETWLVNAAPAESAPRVAVLVDYVPVAGGFGFPFESGERLEGEVVFYPSAAPLQPAASAPLCSIPQHDAGTEPLCSIAQSFWQSRVDRASDALWHVRTMHPHTSVSR